MTIKPYTYYSSTYAHSRRPPRGKFTSRLNAHALVRQNVRLAKRSVAAPLTRTALCGLRDLTLNFGFSVALGELLYLDSKWYVTHAGLLRLARLDCCSAITVTAVRELCDPEASRWVFKAVVYRTPHSKGFVGYGDADPTNASPVVRGAEMRVAETRAVNRALRKAYGIGLCSVEELGSFPAPMPTSRLKQATPVSGNGDGSRHSQPRLRDQLCLLIRQHNLDPSLVKAYAADFCGTATLKQASRELVESFISQLATAARDDRDALLCKLNSYSQPSEAKP